MRDRKGNMMKNIYKNLVVFGTGFLQVGLISAQTWMIAHGRYSGVFTIGFFISLIWTFNVSAIVGGKWWARICYSLGAALGSLCGMWLTIYLFRG
jgi:hypothetical protein